MKKTIVIFVDSQSELQWALDYFYTNSQHNVVILTPHFSLREQLKKNGIPADNYFLKEYAKADFYRKPFQKIVAESEKYIHILRKLTHHIQIGSMPYFETLVITLEIEFSTLLFAYYYLRYIKKKYNPSFFYVSREAYEGLTRLDETKNILPHLYKVFFLEKKNLGLFTPKKEKKTVTFNYPFIYLVIRKIPYLLYNFIYRWFRSKKNKQQTDILLFSAGLNLYYYHNVIPQLEKKYSLQIVTGLQPPEDEYLLHRHGIHFVPLTSFWEKEDAIVYQKLFSRAKKELAVCIRDLKHQYVIKKFPSEMANAIVARFSKVAQSYLAKHVKNILLAQKAVANCTPRVMITTHDPGPSAIPFVFEAKKRNIKSIVLLHGWNDIILGQNYYSDLLIGWGPFVSTWFVNLLNKKKHTLLPGGFPLLDDVVSLTKPDTYFSIPEKPIFGLLLTMYPLPTYFQDLFLEEIFNEAQKNKFQGEFWIRVHRGQDVSRWKSFSQKYTFSIKFDPVADIVSFVQQSDIILGWDTTALYYPMLFRKPLFYTTPLWGEGITPVKEFNAAWIPRSARDVFSQIEALKKNPNLVKNLHAGQKRMLKEVAGVEKEPIAKKITKSLGRFM